MRALAIIALAAASRAPGAGIELIADPGFAAGFRAFDARGVEQTITWNPGATQVFWQVRQHHSRSCAGDRTRHAWDGRTFTFRDEFAALSFGTDGAALALNAAREYDGRYRAAGDPWPHLFLEQRISEPRGHLASNAPSIANLARLDLSIDVRLARHEPGPTASRDAKIHAAQFLLFLTIQNLNRASAGYGDYVWFGTAVFDDREAVTRLHAHRDAGSDRKRGTDKFIYDTGIAPYSKAVVGNGDWVSVRGDLLPQIQAGLAAAWKQGFLPASTNAADYRVGGVVIGWEVTGLHDVEMAVRALSIRAVPREQP